MIWLRFALRIVMSLEDACKCVTCVAIGNCVNSHFGKLDALFGRNCSARKCDSAMWRCNLLLNSLHARLTSREWYAHLSAPEGNFFCQCTKLWSSGCCTCQNCSYGPVRVTAINRTSVFPIHSECLDSFVAVIITVKRLVLSVCCLFVHSKIGLRISWFTELNNC